MKFKKWIEAQGGPRVVAQKLGVESPTVNHWLKSHCTPKATVMVKLVKLGRGAFTFEDIILETKKVAR